MLLLALRGVEISTFRQEKSVTLLFMYSWSHICSATASICRILVVFQKYYIFTRRSCRFMVLFPKLTLAALLRMQQPILAGKTFNLYECEVIMQVFKLRVIPYETEGLFHD